MFLGRKKERKKERKNERGSETTVDKQLLYISRWTDHWRKETRCAHTISRQASFYKLCEKIKLRKTETNEQFRISPHKLKWYCFMQKPLISFLCCYYSCCKEMAYKTRSNTLKLQRLIEVLRERGSDLANSLEATASDFLDDVKPKSKPPAHMVRYFFQIQ